MRQVTCGLSMEKIHKYTGKGCEDRQTPRQAAGVGVGEEMKLLVRILRGNGNNMYRVQGALRVIGWPTSTWP